MLALFTVLLYKSKEIKSLNMVLKVKAFLMESEIIKESQGY